MSTGEEEVSSGTQLAAAWAGGERGMSVTRELLRALPSLLSQQAGVLVFWTSSDHDTYCGYDTGRGIHRPRAVQQAQGSPGVC